MTGIVIVTAAREDAYQDYQHSIEAGHDPTTLTDYLDADTRESLTDPDTDKIHLWGTAVESKWTAVEPGDIALVYHDDGYIAQATVAATHENHALAEHLWNSDDNPWDPERPWQYLTFLTDVESIAVDAERFNDLVNYDPTYRPQGFTRVADTRIDRLLDTHESVESAIADLTGEGVRVHEIDEDEPDAPETDTATDTNQERTLGERLVAASTDGDRAAEFEELVARAFSRLGFTAQWIEGGGDTDVEITAPISAIVEVKVRGSGALAGLDTKLQRHSQRHGADHILVVAPDFRPAAIEDATAQEVVLLSAPTLEALLTYREQYGVPPEAISEYLTDPGAVQDDRLDQLDADIRARRDGGADLLAVLQALDRADPEEGTAHDIRLILKGMYSDEKVPSLRVVEQSLDLLAHPAVDVVHRFEDQYELTTTPENARVVLERLGTLIDAVEPADPSP
jgi:PHD/YefM family antitoxin component YafN of YafNO toxin-antitoxin module